MSFASSQRNCFFPCALSPSSSRPALSSAASTFFMITSRLPASPSSSPIASATPTERKHWIAQRCPTALWLFIRTSLMLLSSASGYMPASRYRVASFSRPSSLDGSSRTAFLAFLISFICLSRSASLGPPGSPSSAPPSFSASSSCITLW